MVCSLEEKSAYRDGLKLGIEHLSPLRHAREIHLGVDLTVLGQKSVRSNLHLRRRVKLLLFS